MIDFHETCHKKKLPILDDSVPGSDDDGLEKVLES